MKGLSVKVERDRERWHISHTMSPKVVCSTQGAYERGTDYGMMRSAAFSSYLCHQIQTTAKEFFRCMLPSTFWNTFGVTHRYERGCVAGGHEPAARYA
jgi:hypothetical protein